MIGESCQVGGDHRDRGRLKPFYDAALPLMFCGVGDIFSTLELGSRGNLDYRWHFQQHAFQKIHP